MMRVLSHSNILMGIMVNSSAPSITNAIEIAFVISRNRPFSETMPGKLIIPKKTARERKQKKKYRNCGSFDDCMEKYSFTAIAMLTRKLRELASDTMGIISGLVTSLYYTLFCAPHNLFAVFFAEFRNFVCDILRRFIQVFNVFWIAKLFWQKKSFANIYL